MSLSGKVALVTGASRGLGKGIAVELGREGATVYVTGRPPQSALNFPNTSTLKEVAEEVFFEY
jgi:NAD(P)-dependent dehydrogenase (short-subunit alcohol dehydrogenase family)